MCELDHNLSRKTATGYKAINFETWLRNNYPDEQVNRRFLSSNPEHDCLQCEGTGILDVEEGQDSTCLLCMGTGSDRYIEYKEMTAIEREKWDKWNS